ncbi:MAG: hypothetical protein SGI99_09590 [Pseudomonadota bacterium]|nr:hypothetical protein [Pseudomonadota bacterium]
MKPVFDDALNLADRDFATTRVVVFCGESGSGKSSAIRFVMHRHPHFQGDANVRVIEELRSWFDLSALLSALWRGRRLLVASHLPIWLHQCLGLFASTQVIALDQHSEKISRWLSAQNVSYSDAAVTAFCRRFGANYTDARLVLRHGHALSFDQALGQFFRQCRIEHAQMPSGLPVLTMPVSRAEAHYQALDEAGGKNAPGQPMQI